MSARLDYPKLDFNTRGPSHQGETSRQAQAVLDEIDRLRAELTVANNRLGNAVGALIDAGTFCAGPDDVTAGIDRLRVVLEDLRRVRP